MLISYSNHNEVLVTTAGKEERKLLKEFFEESIGRSLDDYDRQEHRDSFVQVESRLLSR